MVSLGYYNLHAMPFPDPSLCSHLLLSVPPPPLRLPNRSIRHFCIERSPKGPHDRVRNLPTIHTGVVETFVVLVLLRKSPRSLLSCVISGWCVGCEPVGLGADITVVV